MQAKKKDLSFLTNKIENNINILKEQEIDIKNHYDFLDIVNKTLIYNKEVWEPWYFYNLNPEETKKFRTNLSTFVNLSVEICSSYLFLLNNNNEIKNVYLQKAIDILIFFSQKREEFDKFLYTAFPEGNLDPYQEHELNAILIYLFSTLDIITKGLLIDNSYLANKKIIEKYKTNSTMNYQINFFKDFIKILKFYETQDYDYKVDEKTINMIDKIQKSVILSYAKADRNEKAHGHIFTTWNSCIIANIIFLTAVELIFIVDDEKKKFNEYINNLD